MKGKAIWLVLSCLMALSLVAAACAPAAPPEEKVTPKEEAAPKEALVRPEERITPKEELLVSREEKPRYGGILRVATGADVQGWDQIYVGVGWGISTLGQYMANERLTIGDWTLGPAGSNKTDYTMGEWMPDGVFRQIGYAVESFDIPDNQTIVFKVRKGVYWHNKPPVNGRQMTADDIVFSLKYMYLNPDMPRTYNRISAAKGAAVLDVYIDPKDPWTVIVKLEGGAWSTFEPMSAKGVHIIAREVVEKYGSYREWQNNVGTGPWELIDYVPASSVTFQRFDNYWMKNPIGPGKGDQLPYMDGVRFLLIPDRSTRLSAFRTGKIDWDLSTYPIEDLQSLQATNPEILSVKASYLSPFHNRSLGVAFTNKNPSVEWWFNQRIRWALMMAIDQEAIYRDFYQGSAKRFAWFFPESSPYATTLDQKVEILERVFKIPHEEAIYVKKMFDYLPDEARQILKEEGYPKGFKTSVIAEAADVPLLSIIKKYWADIGVELELDIKTSPVWRTYYNEVKAPQMITTIPCPSACTNETWVIYGPGNPAQGYSAANNLQVYTPILGDYAKRTAALFGWDDHASNLLMQEFEAWFTWYVPHMLGPTQMTYNFYQPWLKNFYGIDELGRRGHFASFHFAWIDQDLREKITGKR